MRITRRSYHLHNFEEILSDILKKEFQESELPRHYCEGHFYGETTFTSEKLGVFRGMIELTNNCFTGEEQIQRIIAEVSETVGIPITYETHSDNRIIMYWLDDAAVDMNDKYEAYDEEVEFRDFHYR